MIDDVPTIIKTVHGNVANGYILLDDLTLKPCYIAKHGNIFAHGDTLAEAISDLHKKIGNNTPRPAK